MFLGANIYDDVSNSWSQFVDNSGYAAFDAIGGATEALSRILVGSPNDSGYGGGNIFFEAYKNNSTSYVRMRTNGGNALFISNAGNTLLGSESDNGYKLQVAGGNIWSNGVRIGRDFSLANRATVRLDSNGNEPADILFGRTSSALETGWTGVYWSLSSRGSGENNDFRIYRGAANTGGSELVVLNLNPTSGAATFSSSVSASSFNANVSSFGTDVSVNSTIRVGSAFASQASIIFGDAGTPYWNVGRPAGSSNFSISSYALTALTIHPTSGNVGLGGITNPQTQLHLNGTITFSEAGFNTVRLQQIASQHSDGSSTNNFIRFLVSNGSGVTSERMRINGDGHLYIGTQTSILSGATLHVNGTGAFGQLYAGNLSTGALYSNGGYLTNTNPSDFRLKNTIKPLTYGLNEILQLNPKTFYYNDDITKARLKYGFIAQDVKEVMPELARKLEGSSDYLGLETEGIFVTLVNAVKELKAELDLIKNNQNNI
jgi:hypothetical protein